MQTNLQLKKLTDYGNIVKDIERVQQGYELIKLLNRSTEDETDEAYFTMIEQAFEALNDEGIKGMFISWYEATGQGYSGPTCMDFTCFKAGFSVALQQPKVAEWSDDEIKKIWRSITGAAHFLVWDALTFARKLLAGKDAK